MKPGQGSAAAGVHQGWIRGHRGGEAAPVDEAREERVTFFSFTEGAGVGAWRDDGPHSACWLCGHLL